MANIALKKIDETNCIDCFNLKLAEGQENFVSHPIRSLAQAYVYYHQCTPFGIYAGEIMVGYVMVISKTSELYLGEESLLRLFLPYPNEYFATPYADPWNDASYPVYLLKTALFGEFTYEIPTWIPVVLLNLNLIVVLLAIVGGIRLFARKDADKYPYLRFGVPVVWALLYVSCVSFNITLPYGCSMDFRYLVFTAMLGAVCLGDFFSDLCASEQKTAVALRSFITVICALFSLGSAVMFCMI